MTRVDETIEVEVANDRPDAFRWRGRLYEIVEVLHTWSTEEGAWWKLSRPEKRRHYRVQAGWNRHRITAELYASVRGDNVQWILAAVYD